MDTGANNFHLKTSSPGSPAIDKGVNSYVSGVERVPSVDFEGDSRPIDGDGVGGAVTDIGYDEATASCTAPAADAGPDQEVCAASTSLAGNNASPGTGTWSVVSGTGAPSASANDPATRSPA